MSIRARVTKRIAHRIAERTARAVNRLTVGEETPTRRRSMTTVRWLRRHALRLQRGPSVKVRTLLGEDRSGGRREVLYLGERQALNWFAQECFGGPCEESERESVQVRDLSAFVEAGRRAHDLVVLEADHLLARRLAGSATLSAPRWVRMSLGLPPTWDELKATWSRNTKKEVRQAMRDGYSTEESTSLADFDAFYEQQYLPLIELRHASTPVVAERDYLKRLFREGLLLRVLRNGEWVAGQLLYRRGDWARCVCMGLLASQENLLRRGVLKAIYCASLRWGIDNGVRTLDLGRTRPSLNDGVFRYKRSIGAEVCEDPCEESDLVVFRGRSSFCEMIEERSPFVGRAESGTFFARVVLPADGDSDDDAGRARAKRLYATPGLSELKFVVPPKSAGEELSRDIAEAVPV